MTAPMVVAFGGGVNSVAVCILLRDRGERPDAILFADTGGEREVTYEATARMQTWCKAQGFPPIVDVWRVDKDGNRLELERHCLDNKTLPSLAFGFKKCSQKFKRQPQDKWVNGWEPAIAAWSRGEKVVKVIGFDADESHRATRAIDDEKYTYRYPLLEANIGRDECVEIIKAEGLPVPPKSSCFFCPASTVTEILALPRELQRRAIAIEDNAQGNLSSVLGLGRRFAWKPLILNNNAQGTLFDGFAPPIACECYDGAPDE